MRLLPLTLVLVAGAWSAGSAGLLSSQQPGLKRTVLQRSDDPAAPTHEIVQAIAEFPPGASSGWHRHPGIEVAYVLEGTIVMQMPGHPDTTLVAGNSMLNVGAHSARNAGTGIARVLATYVVEKGKPLAEPVPAP